MGDSNAVRPLPCRTVVMASGEQLSIRNNAPARRHPRSQAPHSPQATAMETRPDQQARRGRLPLPPNVAGQGARGAQSLTCGTPAGSCTHQVLYASEHAVAYVRRACASAWFGLQVVSCLGLALQCRGGRRTYSFPTAPRRVRIGAARLALGRLHSTNTPIFLGFFWFIVLWNGKLN
jgi:hypothetical protein